MERRGSSSKAEEWGRRLARQQRSGLSVAEFCRRESVTPASFYAWRKRLSPGESVEQRPPLFVPVRMAAVEPAARGVRIELPSGAIATLPAEASAELVAAAIRAALRPADSKEGARPC